MAHLSLLDSTLMYNAELPANIAHQSYLFRVSPFRVRDPAGVSAFLAQNYVVGEQCLKIRRTLSIGGVLGVLQSVYVRSQN